MKPSWRKAYRAAKSGQRIWAYTPGKVAFICLGNNEYAQVRTSTLEAMEEAGLLRCEQKENWMQPERSCYNDRSWILNEASKESLT